MEYKCTKCGIKNRKLWRDYQTFLEHLSLYCLNCACEEENIDPKTFNQEFDKGLTDQIGWLVPAVPTEDGSTFWGYTSVPEDRVNWWKELCL